MDKDQIKQVIAKRAAQELSDGQLVNLGIGIPTLVPGYLPKGVQVVLDSENGIIRTGAKPSPEQVDPYTTDAGGQPASVMTGGAIVDSLTSFALLRGGHVDATILGALQVDEEGNLANWSVPGKMIGMGGAMDLVAGAKRVIIAMEHTAKGNPKILKKCTLPLTAVKRVDTIITEMGVMKVTPQGLVLIEKHPEFTVEQVQAATEATLQIAPDLKDMTA